MKQFSHKKMIAAALMAAAFGSGCVERPETPSTTSPASEASVSSPTSVKAVPINARTFLDDARFRAVWSPELEPIPVSGTVIAGVVNHHILASDVLADFFRRLKLARPDVTRIIILSPDHYHVGRATVSTHLRPYQTPDGEVNVDTTSTRELIEEGFATEDPTVFEKEHGVGALVSFLRHEFSGIRIIPLAVRGQIPRPEVITLGERLAKLVDEQTIVIVSADMSHYLSETQALQNDMETKKALNALDSAWFGRVNDDFTDNGASFVALRAFVDARNLKPTFTLFDHSISTRYGGPADNTTSYLTGVWSY